MVTANVDYSKDPKRENREYHARQVRCKGSQRMRDPDREARDLQDVWALLVLASKDGL